MVQICRGAAGHTVAPSTVLHLTKTREERGEGRLSHEWKRPLGPQTKRLHGKQRIVTVHPYVTDEL